METKDSYGRVLNDGDSVQVVKDLKVKGSSASLKRGKVFKTSGSRVKRKKLNAVTARAAWY
jgi:uncharacterized Zn ribbon protein